MSETDKIIGIDLGTTNSVLGVIQDGKMQVWPIDGERLLPSVVGVSPAGEVLVGTADGVVSLTRSGGAWRESRRALAGKHIGALTIEPTRGVIFAGTHGDGLHALDHKPLGLCLEQRSRPACPNSARTTCRCPRDPR